MRRLVPMFLLASTPSLCTRAHDIPNARVDRSIQATLVPGRLTIDYEVSLSELTLTQDLRMLIGVLPGADRRDWFIAYGRETGPLNARGLLVAVDRQPLELRFVGFDLAVEEHPRFSFHFEAMTQPRGRLTIQDTNYAASEGTSRLAVRGREGVVIRGDELPPNVEEVPIRPVWQLSDAEERRTKYVAVEYALSAPPPTSQPELSQAPAVPPLPSSPLRPHPPRRKEPGFGSSHLTRLLDRTAALPVSGLLLISLGLGAVHALQPGHGKTLVAAAVLDDRGTCLRGAFLAILTTLTHTGSVLLVALGLWWTNTSRYGEIHLGLAHVAGGLIAAIGFWRLGRHLARYGEHDAWAEAEAEMEAGRDGSPPKRGLIGLGIAGGLVPCWDAVVLIVLAGATGRLALGIVLLLAFGLGMALVLVTVGVVATRIRRLVARGPGDERYGVWERRLGMASGLTLAAIGVYLLGMA
jgi:nickel/cobalt transporter (NicO) family protein